MHLALQVSELDERGNPAVARGRELGRPLAQLRRDGLVAEVLVERVLARVRDDLAGLDRGHAVLGDREAAAHRLFAQRDVVVLRAGEALEHVP